MKKNSIKLARFLLIAVLCAVTALSTAGCGQQQGSSQQNSSQSSSNSASSDSASGSGSASSSGTGSTAASGSEGGKTFTVGFDAEYPPYGYKDEKGEYTGFDLEMAEAVCKLEGWTLVKQPIDWTSKDMELNSGSIDCIWNGFTINGRENDYEWSVPYVDNSQVVVVKEGSGITKLADLSGKTVGVQAASAAYDVLTDSEQQKELGDTFSALQQFSDYNQAFTELQAGALDALAIDIGVANYQLKSRGSGYTILSEKLNAEQYGVGFKKGNTELRDIINKDLKALKEDGTVTKLAEKYEIADMVIL